MGAYLGFQPCRDSCWTPQRTGPPRPGSPSKWPSTRSCLAGPATTHALGGSGDNGHGSIIPPPDVAGANRAVDASATSWILAKAGHAAILLPNGNNVWTAANPDLMQTNAITLKIPQNNQTLKCFLCSGGMPRLRRKRTKSRTAVGASRIAGSCSGDGSCSH